MVLRGVTDGFDLGMRAAGFAMKAAPDDLLIGDDDGTDGRIRTGQADAALSLVEGQLHAAFVVGG